MPEEIIPLKVPAGRESSWTDDLPLCDLSGVGFQTNLTYSYSGNPKPEHPFEDQSFRFRFRQFSPPEYDDFIYGVFDGHDGAQTANYVAQRIPAELILGDLLMQSSEEEVRNHLARAFACAERGFFESISDDLASRANLPMLTDMKTYEATQRFPEAMKELERINSRISSGCTGVVAVILRNKLYVANVGDCRALLCKYDVNRKLRVIQLSVDHDIELNADEQLRLSQLGLSREQLIHFHHPTRCIGDFPRKGGYRDIEFLRDARGEPVIADAEVRGGILLDSSCQFLVLLSGGLWRALSDATGSVQTVNGEIAGMITAEFASASTLNNVAQAVVDRIARIHNNAFDSCTDRSLLCARREDMTLLVRNLNYRLENAGLAPSSAYNTIVPADATLKAGDAMPSQNHDDVQTVSASNHTNSSYESTYDDRDYRRRVIIPLDENGRVPAYVDFTEFYELVGACLEDLNPSLATADK